MKLPRQIRASVPKEITIDSESRTMDFSFSSEEPYERYWGIEVLSHKSGAMKHERVSMKAVPLLWNHDPDAVIGMVEMVDVKDGRGVARAKFLQNNLAKEKMQDAIDGLRNISCGYQINEMLLSKAGREGTPSEYTVTDWEIFELSLVSIPADPTVGVGRSATRADFKEELEVRVAEIQTIGDKEMPPVEQKSPEVSVKEARSEERTRISTIVAMGKRFGQEELAEQLVNSDKSLDEARAAIIEKIEVKAKPITEGAADLSLNDKEKQAYSLVRAIRAQLSGNWKEAGFERACSDAIANRSGKDTAGFFMPMNITASPEMVRATYAVGAAGTGGNLVATELLTGSFIDLLRNKSVVVGLGARMISGLVGSVDIPRQATASTAAWVTEGNAASQSEATFDLVSLRMKTIAAFSRMTRNMIMQGTPDIEILARQDLALQLALAIDLAALSGSGSSGQPLGIANVAGIGSVVGGTNGLAISIDHLIDLEREVAVDNADLGSLAYLGNAKTVGALKKLKASSGEYLWTNSPTAGRSGTPGEINGYPVARSNQARSSLTKGSSSGICSEVFYGNWNDLLIGEWGILEILANPFGSGFSAGTVDLRAMQSVDVAVRHPESFSYMGDALT